MEIDITAFFNDAEPFDYFASIAERGENAGKETWCNAVERGANDAILTTPEQLEALRSYVKGFGAWDDEHIAGWSDAECNALFIQLVSGDMREIEALCTKDNGNVNWKKYERLGSEGTIGGDLFRGDNGRIYYYLGS